ncbi:hypothetical protein K501DRAFT_251956 [Backusella circina FSU 941]|nr:hypothetical protein K501DRAFT_251956 [Backusella circina FSU 941]
MSKTTSPSNAWSHIKPSQDSSTSFLNLEKVIQNYASQPELLELILASKVEEDKRRAEEAKLRRKEIDYMLQKKDDEDSPHTCSKVYNQSLPSPRFEDSDKPPALATLPPISSSKHRSLSTDSNGNKRRKREMQAITTIIETKEFPYNDDYLWKNNGNTVHKKSGFKSIYYKCTNSSKSFSKRPNHVIANQRHFQAHNNVPLFLKGKRDKFFLTVVLAGLSVGVIGSTIGVVK